MLAFSVVFKPSHPLRPVAWLDKTGCSPDTCCVEVAMPLQRPQFFKTDLSDGGIHKGAVHKSVVSVDVKAGHTIARIR